MPDHAVTPPGAVPKRIGQPFRCQLLHGVRQEQTEYGIFSKPRLLELVKIEVVPFQPISKMSQSI